MRERTINAADQPLAIMAISMSCACIFGRCRLSDLPTGEALEIACPKCGAARYATAAELSAHKMPGALHGETVSLATAYLDQIEARLRCRRCGGPGRLSRVWQDKISGFVGGLP